MTIATDSLFTLRKVYNFNLYPASLMGDDFKNVTVLSILDPDTANQMIDIHARHVQVYPYLPNGTVNDPTGYNYLKVKTASGSITVIGIAWIEAESVEEVSAQTITVVIPSASVNDMAKVRNALVANGFNNLEISIK